MTDETRAKEMPVARRAGIGLIDVVVGVTALLGLLLVLGLSAATFSDAALTREPSLGGYPWWLAAAIALLLLQGLFMVALLRERHRRLKAETGVADNHAELIHTSRLAVVGQLSASIAHEINQPLGAILSNADAVELMLATADPDLDEVRVILADIRKDALRASDVVRQIRTLARKRQPAFTDIDLQDLCRDVLRLVTPAVQRSGVAIRTDFDPQVPGICGDSVLLQQAILNLLLNAMDALADVPRSRAIIDLRMTRSRVGDAEVIIRDHGNGVPKAQLNQLFEAFFSTKTQGLGLGLPIVRSIVESHGGQILAENHPDGGAVFRITIPRAKTADSIHQAEKLR